MTDDEIKDFNQRFWNGFQAGWKDALKPLPFDVLSTNDGVPISDTEYAGMGSGAWSMETGDPLDLVKVNKA